jgi:hypothetical protein
MQFSAFLLFGCIEIICHSYSPNLPACWRSQCPTNGNAIRQTDRHTDRLSPQCHRTLDANLRSHRCSNLDVKTPAEGNDDLNTQRSGFVDAITQDEKTRLCDNLLNSWNTLESIEIELVATLPGYPQSVNGKTK